MSDKSIDGWEGIRTDDQGNVLEIVLEGNELRGRIPVSVTECTRLWKLSLADNALDGVIPDAIARCGALRRVKVTAAGPAGRRRRRVLDPRARSLSLQEHAAAVHP